MADEGRIQFSTELSDKGFATGAKNVKRHIHEITEEVEKSGQQIDSVLDNIGKKMGQAFAIGSLVAFQKNIIDVRGEMESLQISFETLAGERVGKQLYDDIKQFATSTPMMMKDLAKGAQTLLGFNIEAEKVMPILREIGDISMGDAQKFNSLTLAFAQMSSTGKLMGQDLLQMINAGFNPLVQIAQKTGKSVKELKEEMSEGKITVEMVEDAFRSATEEGGKFYGMLEKQSKGMAGAISNLKGAYEDMLNDIGEKEQGVLLSGINLATDIIKHYETFAKILLSVIAAYGSYKAVLLLTAAAHKAVAMWENIRLVMMYRKELGLATAAQQAFNTTLKASPVGLLIGAVSGIVAATMMFTKRTDEAAEAQKSLDKAFADTQASIASEQKNIDDLFDKLRKAKEGTDEYKKVKDQIIDQYGQYLQGLDNEISTLKDVEGAYKAVTKAAREASIARGKEAALRGINDSYGSKYSTMMENLQTALRTVADDDTVGIYLGKVQKELRETGTISVETGRQLYGLFDGKGANVYRPKVLQYVEALKTNEKELNDFTKLVDQRFQEEEKQVEDTTKSVKTLEEAYKDAEKAYDDADKKVRKMQKDRKSYTEKEWKDAQEELEAAKKAFKEIGGNPEGKKGAAAERAAETAAQREARLRKQQQGYLTEQREQAKARTRQEYDLWSQTERAAIEAMRDGTAKNIRQINLEYADRKEALRRQYEDLRREKWEADKRLWEADPKNKNNPFTGSISDARYDLTEAEKAAIDKQREYATQVYNQRIEQEKAANEKAINDYMRQWGNYAQKRKAIEDDAARQIAELEKQKQQETTDDAKAAIKARQDAISQSARQEIERLDEQYGKAQQFMIDLFGDASKKSVAEIDKIIRKYEALVKFLQGDGSVSREKLISDFGFTDAEIDKAVGRLERGETTVKEFTDALKGLNEELQQRSPWRKFTANVGEAIKEMKNAGGDPEKVGKAVDKLGRSVTEFTPQVKQFASDLGNIFDFDDSKIQAAIEGIEGLGTASEGVGQAMSGDIMGGLMKAAEGVSKVIDALDSLWGADYTSYNRLVEQYDRLVSVWDSLIDRKSEYISMSYGAETIRVGKEAIDLVEREAEAYRELGKARLDAGASKGSHSIGRRLANATSDADWEGIARSLGMSVTGAQDIIGTSRMTGLFDLTAEQIRSLQEGNQVWWANMDEDVRKYLESIISNEEKWKTVHQQMMEQLTTTTKENVFSGFLDSLYDIADGSEEAFDDIERNWQQMVNRMVVNNLVAGKFKERLDEWYEKLYDINRQRSEGIIDDIEYQRQLNGLQEEYNRHVSDAQKELELLTKNGIIRPLEEATEETLMTLDTIKSGWKSMLMDMTATTDSWAQDIARVMTEQLADELVFNDEWDRQQQEWLDRYKQVMSDEKLTNAQKKAMLDQLKKEQQQELEKARRDMRAIMGVTGYNPDGSTGQSATVSSMERITVDQAEELIGRMNAGQMIWEQGNELSRDIIASINAMRDLYTNGNRSLSELVSLAQTRNQHLYNILNACLGIRSDMVEKMDDLYRIMNTKM